MEDDGIQLNFASPSSDAAGSRFNKKKQGGRWTDRLKANKAAKRRTEKPEDPAPAKAKMTAPSTSQPAAKRPRPEQAASNPSHVRSIPSARPSSGKGDDFANVDIAALARRAASSSGNRSQPQHDSRHAQGIVSNLFTGPSAEQNDGRAEGVEDLDKMDRKLKLNASNAPLPTSGPSNSTSHKDDKSFEGLGLDPLLVGHLKNKMGIERPTRIQRVALKGLLDPTPLTSNTPPPQFSLVGDSPSVVRDAFIQSQTGSGKTLSYLLPIIQTLLPLASSKDVGYVDRSIGTLGIVLAPTRELARQIWGVTERILGLRLSIESGGGVLDDMAKTVEAKDGGALQEDGEVEEIEVERRRPVYQRYLVTTLLTGGSTRTHEKSRLRKGCPILISTPGRLLDHLQNTASFKVDRLLWLVLDEADRLIEEGFGETLEGIMKAIEGRRRIGIEMDGQGLGRSKKKKFVPGKTIMKAPFDDEDEDEEEGDDDWDYELAGPRKNGGEHKEVSTQMNWPYWALGRRTILCSATVSGEVQKLAGTALRDPIMYRASDAGKIDEDEDEEDEPELKDLAQVGEGQGQVKMEEVVLKEEEEEEDIIEVDAGGKVEKFTPPSQLDQRYMVVPLKLRLVTMVALLRSLIAKMNTATSPSDQGMKVIVFMSCTDSVDFHWKLMGGVQMGAPPPKSEDDEDEDDDEATKAAKLKAKKLKAKKEQEPISYACPLLPSTSIMRLHGSLPLQTRRESLAAFSQASTAEAKHSILFCTSVASRGLDLPLVRAVIQYDLPTEQGIAEYVHRVGRTARVGKGGESWAFVENAEKDWVPWVQEGMSSNEKDAGQVQMRQVAVEDVLKRGFSPKGGGGYEREFEQRATQVQLAFERWVLENNQNATLARQAFSSYVRAYSTHPHEEKRFFHVKNLHLGHLAKCFGLRETPGKIGGGGAPTKKGKDGKGGKRKRGDDESEDEMDEEEMLAAASKGGKSSAAKTDTERRMYEAVRKQGRLTKVGGKLAAGGGDAEYQVATGGRDLEKMVKGRGAVRNRR